MTSPGETFRSEIRIGNRFEKESMLKTLIAKSFKRSNFPISLNSKGNL